MDFVEGVLYAQAGKDVTMFEPLEVTQNIILKMIDHDLIKPIPTSAKTTATYVAEICNAFEAVYKTVLKTRG